MALLHDLQHELLDQSVPVGSLLLKLRYLASKLGSQRLEDWVKFETDGYPSEEDVPEYRHAQVIYRGTFADAVRQLNNVSIPAHLITKFCGENWLNYEIRDALSVIDAGVSRSDKDTKFFLDTGDVKLLIEGKVYPGMACLEVQGTFELSTFVRIQHAVRAKVLDLTLELEKNVPAATKIQIGQKPSDSMKEDRALVSQISQNIFYGAVTNINSSGSNNNIIVSVGEGDSEQLVCALTGAGLPQNEAQELANLAASEKPDDTIDPVGKSVRDWLSEKIKAGATEAWGIGKTVLQSIVTDALRQYYGLSD